MVIAPGLFLMAASLASLPFAWDTPGFVASAALLGLGFGAAQPATLALLIDRVREAQRGLAMSTSFLGFDLGISLGSIGLGLVARAYGLDVVWPIAAAGTMLGLLGVVSGRQARRRSA